MGCVIKNVINSVESNANFWVFLFFLHNWVYKLMKENSNFNLTFLLEPSTSIQSPICHLKLLNVKYVTKIFHQKIGWWSTRDASNILQVKDLNARFVKHIFLKRDPWTSTTQQFMNSNLVICVIINQLINLTWIDTQRYMKNHSNAKLATPTFMKRKRW